jgi:hypothetical protein
MTYYNKQNKTLNISKICENPKYFRNINELF